MVLVCSQTPTLMPVLNKLYLIVLFLKSFKRMLMAEERSGKKYGNSTNHFRVSSSKSYRYRWPKNESTYVTILYLEYSLEMENCGATEGGRYYYGSG